MAQAEINSFDDDAIGKIARAVHRLQAQYRNLSRRFLALNRGNVGYTIRTGITTTNAANPVYPATGCKFVVQFEDLSFTEVVGNCELPLARPWASKFVIARSYHAKHIEQGTRVIIVKIPGRRGRRWWILPIPEKLKVIRFQLTQNLAFDGVATAIGLDCALSGVDHILVRDSIGKWHGLAGFQGWAVQLDDCAPTFPQTYEIIFLEAPARWVEFTLTSDMSGGQATATVDRFWGLSPNGVNPGGTVAVYDRAGLFKRALSGGKGYAVYDERHTSTAPLGRMVVLQCQTKAGFIRFSLNADRPAGGGDVSANVNSWWGTQQDVQNPGATLDVHFFPAHFPHALTDASGIAALDTELDRYNVILSDQMALSCTAVTSSDFCASNATIANITDYDEASFFGFGQRPTSITTALNEFKLAGRGSGDGTKLWLEWSEVLEEWVAVQAQHVEKEFLVDLRYQDCAIEKKTIRCSVLTCHQEEWSPAIQLYSQQFMHSIYKSMTLGGSGSGSGSLQVIACDIAQRTFEACIFDQPDLTEETAIQTVKQTVTEFSEFDGECFIEHQVEIFVLCVGGQSEKEVFCTTDCTSSGGGGSGGG